MTPKQARRLDRFSQIALATALMALADAGLTAADAANGMGIYTGSALGGIAFAEAQHAVFVDRGIRAVAPTLALSVFGGASSCNIAIDLGITGPTIANANSCASGTIAIGEAARLIRDGRAEAMLAGGVEAPLAPLTFGAFDLIKVLTGRNDDPATASWVNADLVAAACLRAARRSATALATRAPATRSGRAGLAARAAATAAPATTGSCFARAAQSCPSETARRRPSIAASCRPARRCAPRAGWPAAA